ncbi:MAG TPA: efflux RND transporter periplasmic adaptor subunit [Candidatus Binatia bacterium]|nr:efflux RND transporter periplasmic adaptor subunit [Candidatus Binatia bacterium]
MTYLTLGVSWLMVLFALSACRPGESTRGKEAGVPVVVKLVEPTRGSITRSVVLPAVIVANQQATLYSKVTGYLKQITVDKGDEVKEGDLLAEIEVPELMADQARYQAEAEIAALDYQRASEAQKKAPDLVVRQEVDTTKARAAMAKANLERAQTLLDFTRIMAPFPGVITRRMVDPGAFVPAAASGSAAQNAALVTLADFKIVRVQVAVPEPEVPRIKKGLPVKVSVEELPGRTFEGSVSRFAQALDEDTRTMLAEIDLENANNDLRPGMYATVRIGVEKHEDALLLPIDAVLFEKAGTAVFTVAGDRANRVPVRTGISDGGAVEILEGIAPNEPVILASKMTLNNGQPVRVMAASQFSPKDSTR